MFRKIPELRVVQPMPFGELTITQGALKDIVGYSISNIRGLSSYKVELVQTKEGLEISVYCQLDDGYDILLVSDKIRERVRQPLEKVTGVRVSEVKIKRYEPLFWKNWRKS